MIGIVDYGIGNLGSILNMYRKLGIEAATVRDPAALAAADRLVLPGIGAFDACITRLRESGLGQPLLEAVARDVPLFGIWVGMQMLFDASEEMGQHEGLHLIPGRVRRFPKQPTANTVEVVDALRAALPRA